MKKRRLKPAVKIFAICIMFAFLLGTFILIESNTKPVYEEIDDYTYVDDYMFDDSYPVVVSDEKILKPYVSDKVSIYKTFYNKDAKEEEQKNSIVYHEGIYMQNSGVDYKSEEQFDVISSLSGTVTNVKEDTLLGKTIEISNSSEVTIMYQSLGELLVKKGDSIVQGQIIAKSGTCKLYSDVTNLLHLEIYKNGTLINPEQYYNTSVKDLTSN